MLKNDNEIKENRNKVLFSMIHICKKVIPSSNLFYFIFFLLKFLGILITANNYNRRDSKTLSISDSLAKLTYFLIAEANIMDYSLICFIVWIIILTPILGFYIIYRVKISKKNIKFTKQNKYLLRFFAIITYWVFIFFQSNIEILTHIYIHIGIKSSIPYGIIKPELVGYIASFDEKLVSLYFLSVINFVFIILLNVMFYQYILTINEPFINSKSTIKIYNNRFFLMLVISLSNFQAICNVHNYFIQAISDHIALIVSIVYIIIYLLLITNFIRRFHYITFFKVFLVLVQNYASFSCVLNIIIFHIDGQVQTTKTIIIKLLLSVLFSLIFTYFLITMKTNKSIQLFEDSLFVKGEKSIESYLTFTKVLNDCIHEPKKILEVYKMINNHLSKCNDEECSCKNYNLNNFTEKFIKFSNSLNLVTNDASKNFKECFEDIVLLVENEIVNFIQYLYKGKAINKNFNVFILHVDFIFHFKKNYLFVNFLIENYSHQIKKLPFEFKYFFFMFKQKVYEHHLVQTGFKNAKKIKMAGFYKYLNKIQEIKNLILKSINDFAEYINIKKVFDNKNDTSGMVKFIEGSDNFSNYYDVSKVIQVAEKLRKHYRKLKQVLKKYFSKDILMNNELSYIITNYFLLVNTKIPSKLVNLFLLNRSLKTFEFDDSSFKEMNFYHPLIIQNRKDKFNILFICQKLCDKLGYTKSSLLGEDYQILLPDALAEQHTILMKKAIFLEANNLKVNKDAFIMTKNLNMFPVYISATLFPTLYQNILIVMDIKPIERHSNDFIEYQMVLDDETNFLAFNSNFHKNILASYITSKMLTKFGINFSNMFNIGSEKLDPHFKESFKLIEKANLQNFNTVVNIFQHIPLKAMMTHAKDFHKLNKKINLALTDLPKRYEFTREKGILQKSFEKIMRCLLETNTEKEIINEINNLYKQIVIQTSTNKLNPVINRIANQGTTRKIIFGGSFNQDSLYIKMELFNFGNIGYYKVIIHDHQCMFKNVSLLISSKFKFANKSSIGVGKYRDNAARDANKPVQIDTTGYYNETQHNPISIVDIINTNPNNSLGLNISNRFNKNNNSSISIDNKLGNPLVGTNMSMNESLGILLKNRRDELGKKKVISKDLQVSSNKFKAPKSANYHHDRKVLISLVISTILLITTLCYNFHVFDHILGSALRCALVRIEYSYLITSLVYSCNAILSACYIDNEYNPRIIVEENAFLTKSVTGIRYYRAQLPHDELARINNFTNKPILFQYIFNDWSIYNRTSTIGDETNRFSYHMVRSIDYLNTCEVSKFYPESQYTTEANAYEKTIYFILNNVMTTYLITADISLGVFNGLILEEVQSNGFFFFYVDLVTYILSILVMLLTFWIVYIFESKIVYIIYYIFIKNRNDTRLEKKLLTFKKVVQASDSSSFKAYEKLISYNMKLINRFVNKNYSETHQLISLNVFNEPELELQENNDNEDIQMPVFKLKLLRTAYMLMGLCLLTIITLAATSLTIGQHQMNDLIKANNIAANFMDRTGYLSKLLLYYQASIILNNINLVTKSQSVYQLNNNFYQKTEDLTKDSVYIYLNDSLFANLYFNMNINRKNIKAFTFEDDDTILNKLKLVENEINSKNYCQYLQDNGVIRNYTDIVNECLELGYGLNSLGLNYAIDNMIEHVTKLYIDFNNSPKDERDRYKFLTDENFKSAILANNNYLRLLSQVYIHYILEEIPLLYDTVTKKRLVFSVTFFIIDLLFILFAIILIVPKLQKCYTCLQYALNKIKKATSL
jgi:hypothetical protein